MTWSTSETVASVQLPLNAVFFCLAEVVSRVILWRQCSPSISEPLWPQTAPFNHRAAALTSQSHVTTCKNSARQKEYRIQWQLNRSYHFTCTPDCIVAQFDQHGNCTTATVDTVVLGMFQAVCISEITVELTTFLASFPGLHAQLLSLAVRKAGEGLDGLIMWCVPRLTSRTVASHDRSSSNQTLRTNWTERTNWIQGKKSED